MSLSMVSSTSLICTNSSLAISDGMGLQSKKITIIIKMILTLTIFQYGHLLFKMFFHEGYVAFAWFYRFINFMFVPSPYHWISKWVDLNSCTLPEPILLSSKVDKVWPHAVLLAGAQLRQAERRGQVLVRHLVSHSPPHIHNLRKSSCYMYQKITHYETYTKRKSISVTFF